MSLRFRVNLLLTLLMLLFASTLGMVILDDMRSSVREEIEASSKVSFKLLGILAENAGITINASNNAPEFLNQLGRIQATDIRFYDHSGDLIYQSPSSPYKIGHSAPSWFTQLIAPPTLSDTLSLPSGTLVMTTDNSRAVLEAWDDLLQFLALGFAFFLFVNLLVFWRVGAWLKPVNKIQRGLAQMERGGFDTRLPNFSLSEFDDIGRAFNRLAQSLADSAAENQRLALIAHQSSDAIVIEDIEGKVSFWNPAAERLFGYHTEEVLGQPTERFIPIECREQNLVEHLETQCATKSGGVIDLAVSIAPLIDPHSSESIGKICAMRDITEHKRAQIAERALVQNRELARQVHERIDLERKELARELHDELGQSITAIKAIAVSIAQRSHESAPEVHDFANKISTIAGGIYDTVRAIVQKLRPNTLDRIGFAAALHNTIDTFKHHHPEIEFNLRLEGRLDNLNETINTAVYRIIQEALTNAVRHAQASHIGVMMARRSLPNKNEDLLNIVIEDNGHGMIQPEPPSSDHFGLIGIRERVEALNGEFRMNSENGSGVRIEIVLPCSKRVATTVAATT